MGEMIEFGIDLGTTNSLIAHARGGSVQVLRNPRGFKETLPSVVSYRRGKVVVGDNALAYLDSTPDNVFAAFKRRMGTTHAYPVPALGRTVTPVELSSVVLRELLTFVPESLEPKVLEAVITVPAAFDASQCGATCEAGRLAGLENVILLQEPIAASLACSNSGVKVAEGAKWLVYDLGGGTFDAALVSLKDGELSVLDHEGDNYLGGRDCDDLLVSKFLIPWLVDRTRIPDLATMRNASSAYNTLYYILLRLAEQARIELSHDEDTELEVSVPSLFEGPQVIPVSRATIETLISPLVDRTLDMVRRMLARANVSPGELAFIVPVGGMTYTPSIRKRLADELGACLRSDLDPTNAVAVGAAFYAETRRRKAQQSVTVSVGAETPFVATHTVKMAAARTTQDLEEPLVIQVTGPTHGHTYRLLRQDGGFDSGKKPLTEKVVESVSLKPDSVNLFRLHLFDPHDQNIPLTGGEIQILHGRNRLSGQPMPHGLCIEIDDVLTGESRLETLIPKNTRLPFKKTTTRTASKTVEKGAPDHLQINIYEGDPDTLPAASRRIGQVRIEGTQLRRNLISGSDIHITVEVTDSREIRVLANVEMTGQDFQQVFTFEGRQVDLPRLRDEVLYLERAIGSAMNRAVELEAFERAQELKVLADEASTLSTALDELGDDDVSDTRYQLEDLKRRLVQQLGTITRDDDLGDARRAYANTKKDCLELIGNAGTPEERSELDTILLRHAKIGEAHSVLRLQREAQELNHFRARVQHRFPEYQLRVFLWLSDNSELLSDPARAERLLARGRKAIEEQDFTRLRVVTEELWSLLPDKDEAECLKQIGIR